MLFYVHELRPRCVTTLSRCSVSPLLPNFLYGIHVQMVIIWSSRIICGLPHTKGSQEQEVKLWRGARGHVTREAPPTTKFQDRIFF